MKEGNLKEELSLLPNQPGVYRFFDKDGVIIYVGKAKNLKKRVSSYFLNTAGRGRKLQTLVKKICHIEHTIVSNEEDALLLENNMIKNFLPRYNILLKDDKTYPWLEVRKEDYPRIVSTRQRERNGSSYFGPYISTNAQKSIIELIGKLYYIRSCSLPLTSEGVRKGRFSKCLEYHIGNCKAPCEGLQSMEDYCQGVDGALDILKGNTKVAEQHLTEKMMSYASELKFEEALKVQKQIALLKAHQNKSTVVTSLYGEIDVFSLVIEDDNAYCNYLYLRDGAVINSISYQLTFRLEETPGEVLSFAITNIMDRLERKPTREVVVPLLPDTQLEGVTFTVPQRGDKLKVLELSLKNSRIFRLEKKQQADKRNPAIKVDRLMSSMQKELALREQPRHIECFDNSNIQGDYPVSSCVVFRHGKPSKREYRHFNIKTVVGIDDFASMRETVFRRYSRMLDEGVALPQLIVVDGGKGQLSSAYEVLCNLHLEDKIEIVGLAKRMEEIFRPNDPYPLCLDKQGETLKVLMHLRDEAHRFGITFHRDKRSKGAINSELNKIPSLGEKSITKLLSHFKSVTRIKKATSEDLSAVVGKARADAILKYFEK
ncbi:MAG: excinuclease ABC subunit UvrC [Rikenellaceae bacterium]